MFYLGSFLYPTFIFIFFIFSGYWICTFIKRIYCFRKYKKSLATRCISEIGDSEDKSGYEDTLYNFETEICKCYLLLLINFSEITSCVFLFVSDTLQHFLVYRQLGNSTVELPFTNCAGHNGTIVKRIKLIYNIIPFPNGMATIGNQLSYS